MISRQLFLQKIAAFSGYTLIENTLVACRGRGKAKRMRTLSNSWVMPDESAPHRRTWMAFGASEKIWGDDLLPSVQENLATIARTIAKYEPVKVLVRKEDYEIAAKLCGTDVELIVFPIDDLWMRDTGPVFVVNKQGETAGIDFNFNGWGEKQDYARDALVASFVTQQSKVKLINTDLVLEGGSIEVDGHGTAVITESCVLNSNRNSRVSKAKCEAELKKLLGLRKFIWLPGIAVTKKHLEILRSATDADGRKLEVVVIEGPKIIRAEYGSDDFAAGYINFYVINGAVIAPEFGDAKADTQAKETLKRLFPDRDIVQINIDAIAAGGGGIHCTTQQEPLA